MRHAKLYCCLGCLGLGLMNFPAYAAKSDRDQPIEIQADRVVLNDQKGISHYQGNVYMTQGTLKINADDVEVFLKSNRELDRIIIKGKPAKLQQKPDNSEEVVKSKAHLMEYFADDERLILKQEAEVLQGVNLFRGDFIEYDTRTSTVKARKEDADDSRVHATILPKKDKDNPENDSTETVPVQ